MTEQDADLAAVHAQPGKLDGLMRVVVQRGEREQVLCRACTEEIYYFGIAAVGCNGWKSV